MSTEHLIAVGVFIGFCVGAASLHFFMEKISRQAPVIKPPEEVAPAEAAVEQTLRSQLKIAA